MDKQQFPEDVMAVAQMLAAIKDDALRKRITEAIQKLVKEIFAEQLKSETE